MAATNFYFGNYASSPYTNTALNTAMASLASGAFASSGIITPATDISATPELAICELVMGAAMALGATDTGISLFIVPVPDGTDQPSFPSGPAAAIPARFWEGVFPLTASGSFVRGALDSPIEIPPYPFILGVQNNTSVAFDATATLNVWSYNKQAA